MKHKRVAAGFVVMLAAVFAGCTQTKGSQAEYSGLLGDYSRLQPARSPDGEPVMRWVSPDLRPG